MKKNRWLNPFVYLSDTDIRFYLLIIFGLFLPSRVLLELVSNTLVVISSIFYLFGVFFISFDQLFFLIFGNWLNKIGLFISGIDLFLFDSGLNVITEASPLFITPLLAYRIYNKYPIKKITEVKLVDLNKIDQRDYILELENECLDDIKPPKLMYQRFNPNKTAEAFTFGTRNEKYIGLSTGMISQYKKNINDFKTIILHELGHIVNRDVEKAYLAASTLQALLFVSSITISSYILYWFLNLIDPDFPALSLQQKYFFLILEGGTILSIILFLIIVYVLRNQIIREREFYADARVLDWEGTPNNIIKTLELYLGEKKSQLDLLSKFHPNVEERIRLLEDNSSLFDVSLWVAYGLGFCFNYIVVKVLFLFLNFFPGVSDNISLILFFAAIGQIFLIFPMLAVSSGFHKSLLKDIFIDGKKYFSNKTLSNLVKFAVFYSLGFFTFYVIESLNTLYRISFTEILITAFRTAFFNSYYFLFILFYLIYAASLTIRRSFSNEEAKKNFYLVTLFSSILYFSNTVIAAILLKNDLFVYVFFILSLCITYLTVRIKDRNRLCPNCQNIISDCSNKNLICPHCKYSLFSWVLISLADE